MSDAIVPVVLFVVMGFVAWIVIASIRRFLVARTQANVQLRLLDRLNSVEGLIAYGETDPGRQFMASLTQEKSARNWPYTTILFGVQAGILLIVFGATILLLHHNGSVANDESVVFGAIPVALGVGFSLAAAATYVLSGRFGLLDDHTSQ